LFFSFSRSRFSFYSQHEMCKQAQGLPYWKRKGWHPDLDAWGDPIINRTEVLAMAVLERSVRELVAVEYIETTRWSDPYLKSEYGGVFQPDVTWARDDAKPAQVVNPVGTPSGQQRANRFSPATDEQSDSYSTFFITAFITPPPWAALDHEFEQQWEPSNPVRYAPCVWKLIR
jgi:hypothetical protein